MQSVYGKDKKILKYDISVVDALLELSEKKGNEDPESSLYFAQEAYSTSVLLDYDIGIGKSLLRMGFACSRLAKHHEGLPYLFRALEIFEKLNDKNSKLKALNLIGIYYFYWASYEHAIKYFLQALDIAREVENFLFQSRILNNLGEIYRENYQYEEALKEYSEAVAIVGRMNDKFSYGSILINMAMVYDSLNEISKAIDYYTRSLEIFIEIGEITYEAECLNKIGEMHKKLGDNEAAENYFYKSYNRFKGCDNKFYIINSLISLGSYFIDNGQFEKAIKYLKKAQLAAEKIGAIKKLGIIHYYLWKYYENKHDLNKSVFHYNKYNEIQKEFDTQQVQEKIEAAKNNYTDKHTNSVYSH